MTDKEKVLARFPLAKVNLKYGRYEITDENETFFGESSTEGSAWTSAAKQIEIEVLYQYSPNDSKTILMWRFEDAPEYLRALSINGGDEDWLVFIPTKLYNDNVYYWSWLNRIDSCETPDVFPVLNGYVLIGSHA